MRRLLLTVAVAGDRSRTTRYGLMNLQIRPPADGRCSLDRNRTDGLSEERRRLSRNAQAILHVLRKEWEMSTADLRDESGVKDRKALTRGVDELQAAMIVVPSEVFYQPKFTYICTLGVGRFPEALLRRVSRSTHSPDGVKVGDHAQRQEHGLAAGEFGVADLPALHDLVFQHPRERGLWVSLYVAWHHGVAAPTDRHVERRPRSAGNRSDRRRSRPAR
jgi:hypothetical protein